ncbi:zona pellucida sperm-binding protein 4-like [Pseudophryne corroboree]|uniref:zona pellucida sperm-binding protein 4-like n=1 Tax=Pseudophryne corroboree TaxID=495146 RepID=UPI003081982F
MGSFTAGLGLVGVIWICSLQCVIGVVQDYWDDASRLQCGPRHMNFTLPSVLEDAVFVLSVIDDAGKSHYLHTNPACGTWVGQKADGSMVVGAAYDGCYTREEDGDHVMTISLEEVARDGKAHYHKKDLKCPILTAMDAPSPSVCSSVQQSDRLPCANASVSQAVCEGIGCCFSPSVSGFPCYYGDPLTAQCTDDYNMVVAISSDLTYPSLIMNSINVLGLDSTSCPALSVSQSTSFKEFQFPLSCGGTQQFSDQAIIYEYTFVATKDVQTWQTSSITRDSTMKLTVRCIYSLTGVVPLQVEVITLPPPLPVSTSGPLLLEMRISQDGQYSSYYADGDFPVVKVLRDPVFLEVRILQRTDPNLVLVLNNCWATQSPLPTDSTQWPVLFNGCPFVGDNYLTQLVAVGAASQNIPFPTYYQRFAVSTFTFVDQSSQMALNGLVYFHCSATVCVPSARDSCVVNCASRKKRMADTEAPEETLTTVTSNGPVLFNADEMGRSQDSSRQEVALGSGSVLTWLRGAAAVGVILAITIVASLLYRRQHGDVMSAVYA